MTVLFGDRLQAWFSLIGLPWNLPAMPCILLGPPLTLDRTRSQLFFFPPFFSVVKLRDDLQFMEKVNQRH